MGLHQELNADAMCSNNIEDNVTELTADREVMAHRELSLIDKEVSR